MAVVIALATACSNEGRPTANDVEHAIEDAPLTAPLLSETSDELVECVAESFSDSDLSDNGLRRLVDGEQGANLDSNDRDALDEVEEEVENCGRPSADEIADALEDNSDVTAIAGAADAGAIECMAETLHDSELSDEAIQALVDGEDDFEGDDEDQKVLTGLQPDFADCVTG